MGTRLYWAPERWDEDETYGKRSEVWALSASMYEMRMGSSLFSASKGKKKYRELMEKGDFTVPKDDYSLEFLHLLSETLVRD